MNGFSRARTVSTTNFSAPRRLSLESLEPRQLLAATDLELLIDLSPNAASTAPIELTNVGGTLFFSATLSGANRELWKSDGTFAGTEMVKDINPGTSSPSDPLQLTNVAGTLYFTAISSGNGRELWKSDGTAAGTVMVKNINAGSANAFGIATAANTTPFASIGNTVFFSANDGAHGFQLWKSNGTEAGTQLVTTFAMSASPKNLTVVGQTLYFVATEAGDERLYKTDAAGSAPTLVKNINGAGNDDVDFLTVVGTAFGNTLYFRATDGTSGLELWKSDGTTAGTVLVDDIREGANSSYPNQLTNVGGMLFFTAINQGANRELYKSNGIAASTEIVKEINAGLAAAAPTSLTNVNGTLFFAANDGTNVELWKSDGAAAGTVRVKASHLPTSPTKLVNVAGTLYMSGGSTAEGIELWRSDGTDAGTALVKDLEPGAGNSSPTEITEFLGRVMLVATTTAAGSEIWQEPPARAGDFDQDNDVDGNDFLRWQRLLGSSDASADANNDGTVNAPDLAIWRSNFGAGGATIAAAPATSPAATSDAADAATSAAATAIAPNVLLSSDLFAETEDERATAIVQASRHDSGAASDQALEAWPSVSARPQIAPKLVALDADADDEATDDLWAEWPAISCRL